MSTLVVRPAVDKDEIFLYELYVAVRGPEFDHAPLTPAQREHLLRMQFYAQTSSYTQQFPNSCYHVVLLDDKPVGRLWVAPGNNELRLVDIALHPKLQSKGIGSVLIRQLQDEATKLKFPIRCSVFHTNTGSLRFHKRLGFQILYQDLMYAHLEWRPLTIL